MAHRFPLPEEFADALPAAAAHRRRLFVSVLAACEMPAPQQQVPQLTYSHLKPYQLDVGRLEVVTEYRAPLREPNIEHIMPVSPEAAAKRWHRTGCNRWAEAARRASSFAAPLWSRSR